MTVSGNVRDASSANAAPSRPTSRFLRPSGRLLALRARKRTLDHAIEGEQQRPAPCSLTLQALKRRRLALKEQIERLRRRRNRLVGSGA